MDGSRCRTGRRARSGEGVLKGQLPPDASLHLVVGIIAVQPGDLGQQAGDGPGVGLGVPGRELDFGGAGVGGNLVGNGNGQRGPPLWLVGHSRVVLTIEPEK